jgi:hypothetical protein
LKISETTHDTGRAYRTTRERFISFQQALDIHDPFVETPHECQIVSAPRPCYTQAFKIRLLLA